MTTTMEKPVHEELAEVGAELDRVTRRLEVQGQAIQAARRRDQRGGLLDRFDQRLLDEEDEQPETYGPEYEQAMVEHEELLARRAELWRRALELRIELADEYLPGLRERLDAAEPLLGKAAERLKRARDEHARVTAEVADARSELQRREADKAGALAELRHLDAKEVV
jgi:chromosome segregation ATPase